MLTLLYDSAARPISCPILLETLCSSRLHYIAWTELAHPGSLREGFIANPSPRALPLVDTLSNSNLSSIRSLFAAR